MIHSVKDMLAEKGKGIWTIAADDTVFHAIEVMADKGVNALVVTSEDSSLAGIVSERDCVRKVVLQDRSAHEAKVSEIMSDNVVTVQEDVTVERCMTLMSQNHIRHLPVIVRGKPVGMVTVGDILKFTVNEQTLTIEELERYIFQESGGEG